MKILNQYFLSHLFFSMILVPFSCVNSMGQVGKWKLNFTFLGSATHFAGNDPQSNTTLWPPYHVNENVPFNHYHVINNDGRILRIGFSGGGEITRQLSRKWDFQMGVLFASKGGAIRTADQAPAQVVPVDLEYESANAIDGNGKTIFYLYYLQLPLTLNWFPAKTKKYFISTGLYFGKLLEAQEEGSFKGRYIHYNYAGRVGSPDSLKFTYKTSTPYTQTDFGFCLGGGYQLPAILHNKNIWVIAEYERGLINISRLKEIYGHDPFNNARFHNESWSLGLSREFDL